MHSNYTLNQINFSDILCADNDLKEKVRLWRNKDRVRKCMFNQHEISFEEHQQWLKRLQGDNSQKFWIVSVGGQSFGTVYLNKMDLSKRTSEWGFYIGEDSFLGKGMGRKIICKLLMLYFDSMKYNELITKVLSENGKALHLYRQFKFQQTGMEKYGENEDVVIFSFSAENWNKYKEELINACN